MRSIVAVWLAGFLLVLACPPQARAQCCPFNMHAQVQMQMQMQRQQMQQQMQTQRQQQQQQQQMMRTHMQQRQTATRPMNTPGMHIPGRSTTVTHRQTQVHQVNNVRVVRHTTHRVVPARLTPVGRGVGVGGGRGRVPLTRVTHTRTTIHRTTTLQRITREQRVTTTRPGITQRPRVSQVRQTYQRPQTVTQTRSRTTTSQQTNRERQQARQQQHRPSLQVRVNMTATCGRCHTCPGNGPGVARNTPKPPPRMDFPTRTPPPGPRPLPPIVRNPNPAPAPIVGFPMWVPPPPGLIPIIRKPDAPPITTIMRPPELPTLARGVERKPGKMQVPLAPLPDLMVQKPRQRTDDRPTMERVATSAITAPDLPPLQGRAVEGPGMLADQTPLGQVARQEPAPDKGAVRLLAPGSRRTSPDVLARAPTLPPLPIRPAQELTLLPALRDGAAPAARAEEPARSLSLDLVLLPPVLPPLPDSPVP